MHDDTLWESFRNPPASHRSAPLWVWNDKMSRDNIRRQLTELATHGFGGAFVHPRPGLVTEYLSDEWFDMWGYALEVSKELGLKLYIYDENSYPSGFAGGHVSSQLPDCWATSAGYRIIPGNGEPRIADVGRDWILGTGVIKAFVCEAQGDDITLVEDVTLLPEEDWPRDKDIFVVELHKAQTLSWTAEFAYVDLLRPEVTKLFLETTYEAYQKRFGEDFGETIPAIFTDEPGMTGSKVYDHSGTALLPYSAFLAEEFRRRRGYSLYDHLPGLFRNVACASFVKPAHKVRYDFYVTVRELWTENFVRPLADWCADHRIALTGHFMEHLWPQACGSIMSPSIMQNYVYQQWPGIDLLLSNLMRDTPTDLTLVTLLELRSVAAQFGKERALCEAYGAGGWDSNFTDYKRMGDYLMVNGVNFINNHLCYSTTAGARKRDHPQSFDWRQSWWGEYAVFNDYLGRVCTALSQGETRERVLLLHPTTTGYLTPKEEEKADLMHEIPPTGPYMLNYLELVSCLTDNQWDFDLGDEGILEEHGRVAFGKLEVCRQKYEAVVLSGDMKNFTKATLFLLREYLDQGGKLLSLGKPGGFVDGETDKEDRIGKLLGHANAKVYDSYNDLQRDLSATVPNRIGSSSAVPRGVSHMRRELEEGTLYFFINHSMAEAFETVLTLQGDGVERMDCWSGDMLPVAGQSSDGGNVSFPLRLVRNESAMLFVKAERIETPTNTAQSRAAVTAKLVSVVPEEDNVLTLDYCDLHLDGRDYPGMNAFEAGTLIYRQRGWNHNPWDNSVQYKDRVISRNNYGADSGFSASYHFTLEAMPERLLTVVERAAFYKLTVNGRPVSWAPGKSWLDHHNGVADILPLVKAGENTITITAPIFDVLLELEPIYLRGCFGAGIRQGRWAITACQALPLGYWKENGYPFYAGAVRYEYELMAEEGKKYLLETSAWNGAACSVWINGERYGLLNHDGNKPLQLDGLNAGLNRVSLRVCGSMKNLLGPHHNPAKVRGSAWPQMWKTAPRIGQPAAEDYDLIGFGLVENPTFFTVV